MVEPFVVTNYVLGRRFLAVLEAFLLLCTFLCIYVLHIRSGFLVVVLMLQFLHIVTELVNLRQIQLFFNMQDTWILFPIL
jgi:hypothetical protein